MPSRTLEIILNGTDNFTKSFGSKLDALGSKMRKFGTGLTAGITAPLVGLGALAVSQASDLEESMNKVQVVFGEAAGSVVDFTKTATTSLGVSQAQALEAAGTFGNLFTAMGIGENAASGMSTELLTLAADLASFNNIDPTVALEKLRAGLVGEVEPLRTLGVNLSAAATEAKALELGLIRQGDALTPAAKAQANFALIMEQTTNAQGDFARTSDGLANSLRIVKAQFLDVAAQLGTVLLPYIQQAVDFLKGLFDRIAALTPEQQKWVVAIAAVAAAIGPLLIVLGSVIGAIGTILGVISGPLLLVIAAVGAAVALLTIAWRENWGGIQEKTAAVVGWLINTIGNFLETVRDWWDAHGAQVIAIVEFYLENIRASIDFVLGVIKNLTELFHLAQEGDWYAFGEKLREIWDETWEMIKLILTKAWDAIKTIVGNLITSVVEKFRNTDWRAVGKGIIDGIKDGVIDNTKRLVLAAVNAAKAALEAVKGFLGIKSPSRVFMEIGEQIAEGLIVGIRSKYKSVTDTIRGLFDVAGSLSGIGGSFGSIFSRNVLDPLKAQLSDIDKRIEDLRGSRDWPAQQELIRLEKERAALADQYADAQARALRLQEQQQKLGFLETQFRLLELIRDNGLDPADILGGLELGLGAGIEDLIDAMARAMERLVEEANSALGIGSPSKVFMGIGENLMKSLASGITGAAYQPAFAATQATAGTVVNNWNLTLNEAGRRGSIIQDVALLKALAR